MQPLILLTNDDGVHSAGLLSAAAALCELGELLIVAPVTQQTGMGRSMPIPTETRVIREILRVGGRELPAYAVPGTPAQAVLFGILALAQRQPDLAVAGINHGENIATTVTASGTVGAAMEAAAAGIPALAVSLETDKAYHYGPSVGLDWETAIDVTRRLAKVMLARRLPFDVDLLNVNVPAGATHDTPWRITRQSRQPYYESFRAAADGEPGLADLDYRIKVDWTALEPGSDVQAFAGERVVSITPLSVDLTSRTDLAKLEDIIGRPAD